MKDELRNFFAFSAPSDVPGTFSPSGDPIHPAGKDIALSIRDKLAQNFEASPVVPHSYYGWAWTVRVNSANLWLVLQDTGHWLIIVRDKSPVLARLLHRSREEYVRFLNDFAHSLSSMLQIAEFRILTESEYRLDDT